jgi:hypothetical protein
MIAPRDRAFDRTAQFERKFVNVDMLNNRFYTGLMCYCGELRFGLYEPVFTKDLFDQVQKLIKKRHSPRRNALTVLGLFRRALQDQARAWVRRQSRAHDRTCPTFFVKMKRRLRRHPLDLMPCLTLVSEK